MTLESKKPRTKKIEKLDAANVTKSDKKAYGTGRRKNAIARVWIAPGNGVITVNKKSIDQYFMRGTHVKSVIQPLEATNSLTQYNVFCTVRGGGHSGQAGAILHGLARALDAISPDFHQTLRSKGLLTRDARVVERKKYGKHKARKSTQFSKR